MNISKRFLLYLFLCLAATGLHAKDKLPETTKDGLVLKSHTDHGAVYVLPDASLADYDEVKILDCYVAFEKNWKRNYNLDQPGLEGRITDQEMQKIKTEVAEVFKESFTKELDKAGYTVVDTTGANVLLIRPAIINLQIAAPDIPTPGIETNIVSSSGSMTLYAELYDSQSSAKIAEVIDSEAIGRSSFAHIANRVTNRQALLQSTDAWAEILVKRLDEAHGKTRK